MKKLFILIGLPYSGKTTWAKKRQEMSDGVIVSADNLRWLIYGQRFWEPGESLVWSIRNIVLRTMLEQGVDTIIDETNTKKERRIPIIQAAKGYDYDVYGIIIKTAMEECIRRAEEKEDDAIIPVIYRMHQQYLQEPPSLEEGFCNIKVVPYI